MSLLGTLQALEAARTRSGEGEDAVIDYAFELTGSHLPPNYPAALDAAIVGVLPWALKDPFFGIHAIKAPLTEAGYVLSRRSRLQIRAFASRAEDVSGLQGKTLTCGDASVTVGKMVHRPVTAFPTLRAQMVVNALADEQVFMDDVGMQLEVLGIKGGVMCGMPASVQGDSGLLNGFAVVLHELSPAHSLRLQTVGLGGARRLGCGLFVHHKVIEGPDAWPE